MIIPDWLRPSASAQPLVSDSYVWSGRTIFIYGLVDPRDQSIRYIGKTDQKLTSRLNAHMQDKGSCHRVHWLNQLKAVGLHPEIIVFETIEGAWPWQEAERFWIARGRKLGWPLTNNTSGGDGVCNLPSETRARMALTWTGRKHKPESIAKAVASRKANGYVVSIETKAKHSAAMKGRKILWVDAIAEAIRKITPEQAEEITKRRASGETVAALAAEFGVHRTTISKIKIGTYFVRGQIKK